jgi:hypothetical protein
VNIVPPQQRDFPIEVGGGEGGRKTLAQLGPDVRHPSQLVGARPADGPGGPEVVQQGGGEARPQTGHQGEGEQVTQFGCERFGHGGASRFVERTRTKPYCRTDCNPRACTTALPPTAVTA